ncbi:MAG: recombinase family protein [Balneola sp.]
MKTKNIPKAYSYVRFSSPVQKYGDSERRQLEMAKKYAKKNELILDTTLDLKDEGISAYKGKHIQEGNLGKFLVLVESGKIVPGSRLIIESIDRLGRQAPFTGMETIRRILEHDVMLVVLDWFEPKEYTKESVENNPGQLSGIVNEVERAYFESKKKADRLSEAWKEKRAMAKSGEVKLTSICPMWLEPVKDDNGKTISFETKDDVVAEIRRMFELKLKEFGNQRIANELNGNWSESTIQKYISDRRVLGEYQPYTKKSGKREPVGKPIKDYYPAIIDGEKEDLFDAVQQRIEDWKEENNYRKGRTGKHKNVFQGRLICGKCGGKLHFEDKGKPPKGGQYLRCSNAKRAIKKESGKRVCTASWVRYDNFFASFFKYISELDLSKLVQDSNETDKELEIIEQKQAANQQRISKCKKQKANLLASIADTENKAVRKEYEIKLETVLEELEELIKTETSLNKDFDTISKQAKEIKESLDNTLSAKEYLNYAENEEELIDYRFRLKNHISSLIHDITVFPSKEHPTGIKRLLFKFKGSYPNARVVRFIPAKSNTEDGKRIVLTRNKASKSPSYIKD